MEDSFTAGRNVATITRAELPPLPPPVLGERRATSVAPPAPEAPIAPAGTPKGGSIESATPSLHEGVEITRAELPPLPPPLTPLAATAFASDNRFAPAAMETVDRSEPRDAPPAPANANERSADAFSRSGRSASQSFTKSSDLKPILLALAALLMIGGIAYFISQQLSGSAIVSQLEGGECIENFFEPDDAGSFVEIFAVSTVDCSEPHAYEVFTTTAALFPDDTYPGIEESFAVGQEFCLNEYEAFIGGGRENLTTWDVWTFVPPEDAWEGDRLVQCLVGDFEQTTLAEGTLRNAATS